MSAPYTLVQAAVYRLSARMGSVLIDTAASLAVFAQDGPARLRQEISLFWEEVELEAERLERGGPGPEQAAAAATHATAPAAPPPDPQEQIDQLRARVAALAQRLERSAS